ncbi:MAG: hypothetical protein LBC27_07565 [Spirochaetaceae bacterium]|nr:hypothetical protein [Spirochaetaceae bacterium]
MKIVLFFIISFIFMPFQLYSQSTIEGNRLKLDLPVFDIPYQIKAANIPGYNFFDGFTHPSMKTALAVTGDIYSAFHFGMKQFKDYAGSDAYWKRFVFNSGLIAGDIFLFFTGYVWLHEAFHSAMFTQAGVRSHIGYDFPAGAYTVPDSPFDDDYWPLFPRILAAGIESEYLLVEKLQENNFFYRQNLPNEALYWISGLQAWSYAYLPVQSGDLTMNVDGERQPVSSDTLMWTYYLFHPWGDTSDDIVIQFSDLTEEEQSFLKNRVLAGLINFISPAMFGIRSIPLGKNGGSWNFALRHYYTSFGTDSLIDFYLKLNKYKFKFAFHNYINYENYFPAIEAGMIDYPVNISGINFLLSPRVMLGIQPKDQQFKTREAEFFGLLGLRTDISVSKNIYIFCDVAAKTAGWLAGNEDLQGAVSAAIGVSIRF